MEEDEFDLAGFCVGVVERDRAIDGSAIRRRRRDRRAGRDRASTRTGTRSSGRSCRRYDLDLRSPYQERLRRSLGDAATDAVLGAEPGLALATLGEVLLTPTRVYAGAILRLRTALEAAGHDLRGIAHITGGGLPGNVPRTLPAGLAARARSGPLADAVGDALYRRARWPRGRRAPGDVQRRARHGRRRGARGRRGDDRPARRPRASRPGAWGRSSRSRRSAAGATPRGRSGDPGRATRSPSGSRAADRTSRRSRPQRTAASSEGRSRSSSPTVRAPRSSGPPGAGSLRARPAGRPDDPAARAAEDVELAAALSEAAIDLVVLAGYMRVVGPAVLGAFPGRILNTHPSLLPAFPGAHAVRDALAHGVAVSGVTVHLVDATLDGGPDRGPGGRPGPARRRRGDASTRGSGRSSTASCRGPSPWPWPGRSACEPARAGWSSMRTGPRPRCPSRAAPSCRSATRRGLVDFAAGSSSTGSSSCRPAGPPGRSATAGCRSPTSPR